MDVSGEETIISVNANKNRRGVGRELTICLYISRRNGMRFLVKLEGVLSGHEAYRVWIWLR